MAKLKELNLVKAGNFYIQQRSFAAFRQTNYPTSLHIKLNIPTQDYSMWMIEAVGYNYGMQQSIRTSWVWYSYPPSGGVGYIGLANAYPGLTAAAVYNSTDGYVCLRADATSMYFIGLILNAYRNNDGNGHYKVQMLSYAFTTTTANQF